MDRNNASKRRAGSSKGSTGSDAAANVRGGGGQDMAETSAQHLALGTHFATFSVLVIEARNLPAPALLPQVGGHRRPPDTWVVCEYGSSSQRTFPRRGTLTPQWNSTLAFTVDANSVQTTVSNRDNSPATDGMQPGILQGPDLIVSLKSSDPTDPHQASPVVVGSVTIQPQEIVTPAQGAEGWFKLVPPDKRSASNFKTEVYLMFKPHLRPKRPLESPPSSTEGHDINAREAENMRRMQALLAWEKGDARVESDASRRDLAKALSARRLFVPPGTSLSALCSRSIPIRTSAHDVLAKLQTPFTRHFSAKSLELGADEHEKHRLAAFIRKNKGLRSLGQRPAMVRSENREEFERIAVGEGFCVAIDPNHITFVWGEPESKLVQLAGQDMETDTIQDHIRNDYRARIELESDGLSAQEAAVLTRRLEDEKELYLNDIEAYITRTLARPHVVKATRHLTMFDVVAGAEHALLLTREGQVFAFGQGNCGKLGLGGCWDEAVPRLVEALAKRRTIQIACGIDHSAAVTDNGSVWTWGDNRFGQLGHGNNRDLATPTRVRTLEVFGRVANVGCGHHFSAAVLANGQLYTWGLGWHGQLGHSGVSDAGERDVPSKSPRRAAAPQQETKKKTDASNRDDDAFRFGGGGPGKKNRADVEEKARLESYLDRFHFFEAKMECDLGHTRSAAKNEDPPKKGQHSAGKEKGKNEERNAGRARSCVTPHLVSALAGKSITSIACGARHMLATEAPNGSTDCVAVYNVFSWGQGAQGQLGHGVAHSEMDPRPIHDARGLPVSKVAAGQTWSAIFVSESEAFVYGLLDYGWGVGEAGSGLAFRDLSVAVDSGIPGQIPVCSKAKI